MKLKRYLCCAVALVLALVICGCDKGQKPPVGINSYDGNASVSQPSGDTTSQPNTSSTPSNPSNVTNPDPSSPDSTPSDPSDQPDTPSTTPSGDPSTPDTPSTPNTPSTPDSGDTPSNPDSGDTPSNPNIDTKNYQPVAEDDRYCYTSGLLTEKQKLLYLNIRNAVKTQQKTLELNQNARFSKDDLSFIIQCINTDFPEYYWLTGEYSYQTINSIVSSVTFKYRSFNDSYTAALTKVVEDFVEDLPKNLSSYQLELRAHDFLCERITYDSKSASSGASSDSHTYSAYGALVSKKCVCEGYSRAMQLLMNRVGVRCTLVRGDDGGGHMWNMIEIGGNWYHLDVTWDDPANATQYNHFYFNVTTEELLSTGRTIEPNYPSNKDGEYNIKTRICNKTTYNYFNQNNTILDGSGDAETITAAIKSAKSKGKKYCEFYATATSNYRDFKGNESVENELSNAVFAAGLNGYSISFTSNPNCFMILW